MKNKMTDEKEKKLQEETKEKHKNIPKDISQDILKSIIRNILCAILLIVYFAILNMAYIKMKEERLVGDIKVFSTAFLIAGIYFLEKAYKNDSGKIAITAIELMVMSLHSLSIMHVITLLKYDFRFYLLASSYVFAIYYILKCIILYTKGRKQYLDSLSDISEIVKKEKPIKKEAQKKEKGIKKENRKIDKLNETNEQETKDDKEVKKKRGRPKKEVK